MKTILSVLLVMLVGCGAVQAQIRVHPTGVNVNANGPTVVFLTFGGLEGYVPEEATWCGELIDAFPDVGSRCDPATLFGRQPLRYELSGLSGQSGFTDIMTIPASVARRAVQAARGGADSRFFYVRRFVLPGAPDVYVAVTCRLTGGGARTPFALIDVQMRFETDVSILSVAPGDTLAKLSAEISYNGAGTLRGRWEVVRPGEELPTTRDLLTEATLPVEERGLQRRYTEVGRFNLTLPPSVGARFILPGPDPGRLPSDVEGLYQVLLRIEATDDKEGNSDLGAAGAGSGVVTSGAVAGFPIPPLRYFVGGTARPAPGRMHLLHPDEGASFAPGMGIGFSWTAAPQAVLYRLEVVGSSGEVHSALLPAGITGYQAPPHLADHAGSDMRWRVVALSAGGNELMNTPWRTVSIADSSGPDRQP